MKKYYPIYIIIIILILFFLALLLKFFQERPKACFSQTCVNLELAKTPSQMRLGLMHRTHLDEKDGMLFIFSNEDIYPFWMKNTVIPLDIIWISSNNTIVHIETALPCILDPCQLYTPPAKALYVIEVNAGFTEKHGILSGQKVEFFGF
mgnify:CR=1 FL=1